MQNVIVPIFLGLTAIASVSASLSGPYLLWGHEKVLDLQPRALVEASEEDFTSLYRNVKAIVIFVRNGTQRLNSGDYPRFQQMIKNNAWSYLPQHSLAAEPFKYNSYVEVINLSGTPAEEDGEIISGYNDAVTVFGEGKVLGILANRGVEDHRLAKRDANDKETNDERLTTPAPSEETEDNFIYIADGKKAILYLSEAPELNITNSKETLILKEHNKAITFDDQKTKGYGRLNIIFTVEKNEKLFMRFNFTRSGGTWYMKAVEVEYKEYKTILPIVGNIYNTPSAPIKFSYRCSAYPMIFTNGNDTLALRDYQVQPWLNGSSKFGDVIDCVGFTTAPIWAGLLVSLGLIGITSIGLMAILDIKTPNRFESSRSKQLTFAVQD